MILLAVLSGFITVAFGQINYAPVFDTVNTTGIDGDLRRTLVSVGVLENFPVGGLLGTLKAHVPTLPNAVIVYSATSDQTVDVKSDGKVILNRKLDREASSETGNNLKVTFVASYTTSQGIQLSSDTSITISVLDVNDEYPTFQNIPYNAKVSEDAVIGQTVYSSIRIQDKDVGYFSEIELTCLPSTQPNDTEGQEVCDTFGLSTRQNAQGDYTGYVFLKKRVDYETKKGYTMTILVKDNPTLQGTNKIQLNNTINILIEVVDKQDSGPRFLNTPITVFVYENAKITTRVGAVVAQDGDEGSPRPIKIVNKDPNKLFLLSDAVLEANSTLRYKSIITVQGNIDREVQLARYEFDVEAIELENGAETNQRVTTKVLVTILDEDDNIPSFEKSSYNVSVLEMDSSSSTGSTAPVPGLNIQVRDPDDPSNAQFTIAVVNQPFPGLFSVTPTSATQQAQVTMIVNDAKRLDYEDPLMRTQAITLRAATVNNTSKFTTTVVTINLEDSNDNSPQFPAGEYLASIRENAVVGSFITTITGSDKDSGENGRLVYLLRGTGTDKFNVDSTTGRITLAQSLDFEDTTTYELLFVAQDQGSPKREKSVRLSITVLNYNDFGPVFSPDSYQTSVNEGDTNILIPVVVKATDKESGDNLTYSIVSGNTADNAFVLHPRTGVLSLRRGINFEETPGRNGIFRLIVQASDTDVPQQSTNTTIDVLVIDLNNHRPTFFPSQYQAQISEIAPLGSFVTNVSATDQDFGSNGNISYYIWSGGQDDFSIDNIGQVTVSTRAKLDVDAVRKYTIIIHARDQGSPPQTGSATLVVTLTDANNKNPSFSQEVYIGSVQESVSIGSSVLQIQATDSDSTSSLQYSIIRSSIIAKNTDGTRINTVYPFDYREAFEVEGTSGIIKTKSQLRRESAAEIDFSVMVQDVNAENNVQQTATALVIITILGSLDMTPYFSPPWTVTNPTYYFTLPEELPIGTVTSTLLATDPKGPYQIKNFQEIANTDVGDYFSVNRTSGQIRVNRRLDYEALTRKLIQFQVRAITDDGARSVDANITVQIQDINDNVPEFLRTRYTFTVAEDRRYPAQIATVFARDKDSGSYSEIEYSLSGQGHEHFLVLKNTVNLDEGILLINNGTILDHETTPTYNLLLHAQDNPQALSSDVRQRSSVPLTIQVTDINDNPPVFTAKEYSFLTVESYEVNTRIGEVRAIDQDSGINGELEYSFQSLDPEDIGYFGLFSDNGVLYSKSSLKGASIKSPYRMVIKAQDRGTPVLSGTAIVYINVTSGQLDNGKPVWILPRIGETDVVTVTNISENALAGTYVIRALANPRTPGASTIYSFLNKDDDEKFVIDANTGIVTVKKNNSLDRETQEIYDLILLATDSLNSTLQSTRLLSIRIQDVDDNRPSFLNCPNRQYDVPQEVSIMEGEKIGTVVFTARACDLDNSPYNAVQYNFMYNDQTCFRNNSGKFALDRKTGVITTTAVLDREDRSSFLLCIEADQDFDVGRKKRNVWNKADLEQRLQRSDTVLYLLVTVGDLNDKRPHFPMDTASTYIFDLPTKDSVYQLKAKDDDSDSFNRIRYSITDVRHINFLQNRNIPVFGAFVINTDSGQVSIGFRSYKAFLDGYFVVTVKAEDYLIPSFFSTYTLTVYVADAKSQVRVVIQTQDLQSQPNQQSFVNGLTTSLNNNQNGVEFIPTVVRYHKTNTGTVLQRTDICFLVVRRDRVLDSYDGTSALESLNGILSNQKLTEPGPCEPSTTKDLEGWSAFWWILVAFAIFMFVVIIILIYAVWALYRNYRSYMETRRTYLVQN